MVWDLKNNPINHREVEIYKYIKKLSGDPEFAHNVSRFVDLRSYLDSNKFKDAEDLRKNVVSNGVPLFSKSEAEHLLNLSAKTGGGVADNIVNGWVQYMYEWQPSFIQEGIDIISPYVFITKTMESGSFGPIFSIALDSVTAILPVIGTSLQTITPEVIGFLPIPEAGPIGAIIGWMLASVFVVLGMLLNISRQHFGQAFILSFLLVPFLGTALYNGALSGEKFAEKTAARRDKLVQSVGDLYGTTAGEVVDGIIPEIGEEPEAPKQKINVLDKLGVPEALRSLAATVEEPKGGKRLSSRVHSKGKWRTQRRLR